MEDPTEFIAVYVTAPGSDVAEKISNVLLEDHLASCVNIIPGVLSLYHWKGEIARDNEVLMMIKTKKNLFAKIVDAVKANHPYEVPEDYLDWVAKSVKSPSEGDEKNA